MRTSMALKLISIAAILLFACRFTGTATPTTEPSQQPTLAPNVYINDENGIQITYPLGWDTETPNADTESLIVFVSPDSSVMSFLFVFPAQGEDSLEVTATDLRESVLLGLEDIEILVDEGLLLTDGTSAWLTIVTAKRPDGAILKINLTTTISQTRIVFLLTYGISDAYDFYQTDITELTQGIHLGTPTLEGIPRDQALILSGGESTNPRDYDPATTHGSGDKLVFSGLVAFDPQLNLVPDLAESWQISTDGTLYTFKLRQNARFHNGRTVTAQDVVYSWERAANPATGSDTVLTYLGDIVGVQDMYSGKADHISGLRVVDDHTLEVMIDAPKPYFLLKLSYPTAFVLDQANIESGSEWYRTPNGTGPYRLTKWERFTIKVYERNQDFYLGPPAIPYIVYQLYSGIGLRLYESGEIDMTGVSSYNVSRLLDPEDPLHEELYSGVSLCTLYILFDVTQPPFDDVKVRQAFTLAFDRQKYIDVVYRGIGLPANGLFPPGLPGYNTGLESLPFDPERARQLLAESKYGGAQGLPPIVYTDAGIGNNASASVSALAQMWEQNLEVAITIENIDPNKYNDLVFSGYHGQIFDGGWCADYPDPENFADVLFHSGSQHNLGNYSNSNLDALLDQARTEQDVERRIQLYQQAEQIIVTDAPALFMMHSLSYVLVKPYVQGFVLTPIDISLERYLWLDWSQ